MYCYGKHTPPFPNRQIFPRLLFNTLFRRTAIRLNRTKNSKVTICIAYLNHIPKQRRKKYTTTRLLKTESPIRVNRTGLSFGDISG